MRALRALGALLALALLLLGIPWVLVRVGRPEALLGVDWATSLTVAMDSGVLVGALSVAAWLAWVVLALTVVLEAVAVLTHSRVAVTLPGTAWLRPVVGALVLAAVAAPDGRRGRRRRLARPAVGRRGRAAVAAPAVAAPSVAQVPSRSYVVQPGDELWGVAERELGEGGRWRELVSLNPGLTESSRLEAGTRLILPQPPVAGPATESVVVQPGDSLWSIAEAELGDPERWPEIHRLNRDRVSDPDQIDTGWVLTVPGCRAPAGASPAEAAPVAVAEATRSLADVADAPPEAAPTVAPAPEEQPAPTVTDPPVALPLTNATPTPSERVEAATPVASAVDDSDDGVATLLGPIGAVLAGSILAGVASRRRLQLLGRAMGRRAIPVPPHLARFWAGLARTAEDSEPGLTPTTVMLGWTADGEPVTADVERERSVVFVGEASEEAIAAVITGLSCTPWADETQLVLVGGTEWADALDDPRISALQGADEDGCPGTWRDCAASAVSRCRAGRSPSSVRIPTWPAPGSRSSWCSPGASPRSSRTRSLTPWLWARWA